MSAKGEDPFYSPKQDRHLRLVPEEDLLAARKLIAALEAQVQTLREAHIRLDISAKGTDDLLWNANRSEWTSMPDAHHNKQILDAYERGYRAALAATEEKA